MLTYEDPTEDELMILMGFDTSSEKESQRIRDVVKKCEPLLIHDSYGSGKIAFANEDLKSHLLENSKQLLGLTKEDVKLQHGILAFRCFAHMVEGVSAHLKVLEEEAKQQESDPKVEEAAKTSEAPATTDVPMEDAEEGRAEDDEAEGGEDEGDGEAEADEDVESEEGEYYDEDGEYVGEASEPEAEPEIPTSAQRYAIVYWLRHASEATMDISDRLVLGGVENEFWGAASPLRTQWLKEFEELTSQFIDHNVSWEGLNSLHVASALGFPQLVESLLEEGHEKEMNEYDTLNNQPVSLSHLTP